ncbi:MAG: hypothetical protein NTV57_18415 [Cyanobacteria bacterium]|nr:hypothetical protein [Cyanobacteriota bacterium]
MVLSVGVFVGLGCSRSQLVAESSNYLSIEDRQQAPCEYCGDGPLVIWLVKMYWCGLLLLMFSACIVGDWPQLGIGVVLLESAKEALQPSWLREFCLSP